jgi:hypothetical protein
MAYQLRFESNALDADNKIGQMLDALAQTTRQVRRAAGMKIREDEVNKLITLRGTCQRTFEMSMDWADKDFDQQMASEKWQWTNKQTKRKNGEIVGSPRDIVDTASLIQSKKRDPVNSSITEFIWEDEVAELVHDGGAMKNGGSYPARPWTEPTVDELDNVIDTVFRKGGF